MVKYTIKDVFDDEKTMIRLKSVLGGWLKHLEVEEKNRGQWVDEILVICKKDKDGIRIEDELRDFFTKNGLDKKIHDKLMDRVGVVYGHIKDKAVGESYLEIGAGDGKVALNISKEGRKVQLLDTLDYNETDLPLIIYDGLDMPFESESFDTSSMLMVLHHCDNPMKVLDEATRVTKKRLLIIESVHLNDEERKINIFVDWFYNRVFHKGVNVPFNFEHPKDWEKIFLKKGLKIIESKDLGIDLEMAPEHHWLFVLEK